MTIFVNSQKQLQMKDTTAVIQSITSADHEMVSFTDKLVDWITNHGIKVVLIIGAAWLIKIISKRIIDRVIKTATKSQKLNISQADIKRMSTIGRLFNWVINVLIILTATMMILDEFDINITPLITGAGIAGVALGFGGQYLVRDIITGFFIIFENQYRIGDVVTLAGIGGVVEDITLRVTTLRDMDGTVHHIPHGDITIVSNMTKIFSKVNLNIGISYNANLDHVIEVVNEVGKKMAADDNWKDFITVAPAFLRVDSFDDSSVAIKIVGITIPAKQWDVSGELRKRIKEAFDKEGIEIPFPQRVIHYEANTPVPNGQG
jgi:moderate conductance mechanosensitive channel